MCELCLFSDVLQTLKTIYTQVIHNHALFMSCDTFRCIYVCIRLKWIYVERSGSGVELPTHD